MIISVTEPYLWLPVDREKPLVKLHFYCRNEKFQEVDIKLGDAAGSFYTCMDVSRFVGKDIEIKGNVGEEKLSGISCRKEKVQNVYPFRPKIHFAPEMGWINDPNGLVFADGVYHLYYQWNPYGVLWGNMHWGHAVSRDLLTWEHRPAAMEPDIYGTVYSGCGWQDTENVAGFGKDALLFFYTAAGGSNEWSAEAGNRHTQRLAVSTDGGDTLVKTDKPVIEHIRGENRDPKVFYHEASGAYVMVLYLEENEFAIFRSADLLHWEETQRFSAEGMWECPDLLELPVTGNNRYRADDRENPACQAALPTAEKKWVFWSADGYYQTGDFDGYRFTPDSGVKAAYLTKLPYAAQTYAGCDDRVISVSWLRTQNDKGNFRGIMALPAELSLAKTEDGYRIRFQPVKELEKHRIPVDIREGEQADGVRLSLPLNGQAAEIILEWEAQERGYTKLTIGGLEMQVDFTEGMARIRDRKTSGEPVCMPVEKGKTFAVTLLIDCGILEFYGNGGILYGAVETEEDVLDRDVVLEGSARMKKLQMFRIS